MASPSFYLLRPKTLGVIFDSSLFHSFDITFSFWIHFSPGLWPPPRSKLLISVIIVTAFLLWPLGLITVQRLPLVSDHVSFSFKPWWLHWSPCCSLSKSGLLPLEGPCTCAHSFPSFRAWLSFLPLEEAFESPLDCKESSQSILKEINPEYSLEGLMLKLKL